MHLILNLRFKFLNLKINLNIGFAKTAFKKMNQLQKSDFKETLPDSTKMISLTNGHNHYKSLNYGITKFVG